MTHPLVTQLHFARHEFLRCLDGIDEKDAVKRVMPMNCLSWIIGHLASQENAYWVYLGQGESIYPELRELVGYGKPASMPPLADMRAAWKTITQRADAFLDHLNIQRMQEHFIRNEKPLDETIGSMLHRNVYHYWFHTGEAHAIRQSLGHINLPDFVGDMSGFGYQPEG